MNEKQQICPCCKSVMVKAILATPNSKVDCDHYMCKPCGLSVRADAWDKRDACKVKKVFEAHLGCSVLDYDTFEHLYLDSLDRIGILMDIEAEFDTEADDSKVKLWETVGDVINYFESISN